MPTSNPTWMNETWYMVGSTDTVSFTGTQVNISGATAQPWGTLDAFATDGGTGYGHKSDGTPFQISYDASLNQLTCTQSGPSPQIPWTAMTLGILAGTLLGGLTGLAARSLPVGAAAGLVAATGSLVTFRRVTGGHGSAVTGTGSANTWVAVDPDGRVIGKPGPQAVPPVRATA